MFGSDIGHWDVVDAKTVVGAAYRLVESKMIGESDFRDFTFTNPAMLHLRVNPDYYRGTVLESAASALLAKDASHAT